MIKEIQHFLPHDPFPIVSIIPISDSFPKFRSLKPFLIIDLLPSVIFITMSYLKSSLRLKPFLEGVISENQSAFIPGRLISDNVLIMHEVLHFLKSSGAVKHCSMAVKTYISKAYDRLEWTFIQTVLERMGFCHTWIQWILQCVSMVSYSFLLNNEAIGSVIPQRGIRQGDLLSHYIFILCGEV